MVASIFGIINKPNKILSKWSLIMNENRWSVSLNRFKIKKQVPKTENLYSLSLD